jgi:photosystem II stability/assembly factor-like uncharacterized protein
MIIFFIYFEIHSCAEDRPIEPGIPAPVASNLVCGARDVFFLDHETGWVLGSLGTIMRTTDGGETWKGASIPDAELNSVYFLDRMRGWVVGKDGRIYQSHDGGAGWERSIFSGTPNDSDLYEIRFIDENLGFILGYDGLYRTEDAGMIWENYWLPVIPRKGAWNMSLVNNSTAYLLGSSWMDPDPELVHKTEDGGLSWRAVEGSESSVLRAVMTIEFIDESNGLAGGGVIMKTTDGGNSWTMRLEEATVREFHFTDPSTGYAVGGRKILRTADRGDSWEDITPADERIFDLRCVHFIDATHGFVVGRGEDMTHDTNLYKVSIVLETEDGGESWRIEEFLYDFTAYRAMESPPVID